MCSYFISNASGLKEKEPTGDEPFTTRGISLLLDQKDEILPEDPIAQPWFNGWLTYMLMTQLMQKSSPILMSKHIYNNFIKMRALFNDFRQPLSSSQKTAVRKKYPALMDIEKLNDLFAATWRVYQALTGIIAKSLEENANPHEIAENLNKLAMEKLALMPQTEEPELAKTEPGKEELTKLELEKQEAMPPVALKDIDFTHNYSVDFDKLLNSISAMYLNAFLTPFNPAEWIIKDVSPAFCLFIPKNYLPELATLKDISKVDPKRALTDLELSLGLRIDHLPNVSNAEILNGFNVDLSHMVEELTMQIMNPTSNSSSLFVTNKEYSDSKQPALKPRWSIVIHGHGEPTTKADREILDKEFTQKLNQQLIATITQLVDNFRNIKQQTSALQKELETTKKQKTFAAIYSSTSKLHDEITSAFDKYFKTFEEHVQNIPEEAKEQKEAEITIKHLYLDTLFTLFDNLKIAHEGKKGKETIELYKQFFAEIDRLSNMLSRELEKLRAASKKAEADIAATKGKDATVGQMTGILPADLSKVINFAHIKIDTPLCLFSTCYAISKNLAKVLDATRIPGSYRMIIIIGAVTNDIVFGSHFGVKFPPALTEDDIDTVNKRLNFSSEADYKAFFAALKKPQFGSPKEPQPLDFAQISNFILAYKDKNGKLSSFSKVPYIKYKDRDWASIIDAPNQIVTFGKFLSTKKGEPLALSTFFRRGKEKIYPELISLDVKHIPSLLLEKNPKDPLSKPPVFIAASPDMDYYYFEEIEAPDFTFAEMLEAFFTVFSKSGKIFFIKTLVNKALPDDKAPTTYSNVVLINNLPDPMSDSTARTNTIEYQTDGYAYRFTTLNTQKNPFEAGVGKFEELSDADEYLKKFDNYIDQHKKEFASSGQGELAGTQKLLETKLAGKDRQKVENRAKYKSYIDLRNDPDFKKWRAQFAKLNPEALDKMIKETRERLLKLETLSMDQRRELDMIRKLREFINLERWYQSLNTLEKKRLE